MDETRTATLRPLLVVLAAAFAAAAIWAATALAGSSGSEPAGGNNPPAQMKDADQARGSHDDCPDRGNRGVDTSADV